MTGVYRIQDSAHVDLRSARTTKGQSISLERRPMPSRSKPLCLRDIAKWCVYLLALLVPGSFVMFILLWLVRLARSHLPAQWRMLSPAGEYK